MCCSGELRWSQRSELGLIFAWGGDRAELALKAGFGMWLRGKEKRAENIFQTFVNVLQEPGAAAICKRRNVGDVSLPGDVWGFSFGERLK